MPCYVFAGSFTSSEDMVISASTSGLGRILGLGNIVGCRYHDVVSVQVLPLVKRASC